VTRVKTKWKVVFRDGMVHANGKDYLFGRCTGCAFVFPLVLQVCSLLAMIASSIGKSMLSPFSNRLRASLESGTLCIAPIVIPLSVVASACLSVLVGAPYCRPHMVNSIPPLVFGLNPRATNTSLPRLNASSYSHSVRLLRPALGIRPRLVIVGMVI
jgi:hypothetical protein